MTWNCGVKLRGTYGKAADEGKHLSCQDELQQQELIKGCIKLFAFYVECSLIVAVRCVAILPHVQEILNEVSAQGPPIVTEVFSHL
jgi:hypothetical protein